MTPGETRDLKARMRVPVLAFAALVVLLGVNVGLAVLVPFGGLWIVELVVALAMVAVVLLFSMEILDEPPLIRLFSILGFCWVGILFAMTLIDYTTR